MTSRVVEACQHPAYWRWDGRTSLPPRTEDQPNVQHLRRAKLRMAGLRSEDAGGSSGGAGVPESKDRDVGCITQVTDAPTRAGAGARAVAAD